MASAMFQGPQLVLFSTHFLLDTFALKCYLLQRIAAMISLKSTYREEGFLILLAFGEVLAVLGTPCLTPQLLPLLPRVVPLVHLCTFVQF